MKKKNRILKSMEFSNMIHTCPCHKNVSYALYYKPRKTDESRIGITLSKKIGNAVQRNKIKRQVRMMCQELIDVHTYPYDLVIIVRYPYKEREYTTNKKLLEKLINKDKIVNCNT